MVRYALGLLALLSLGVGCGGLDTSDALPDTVERRAELAAQLARVAAEHGQFDQLLDEGAELARRAGSPAIELELERPMDDAEQDRMRALLRELLTEFVPSERWQQVVAAVYAEHFTADELERTLAFYDTPLGHKIIRNRGLINEQVQADTRAMFDSRLEEFIERADALILAEFGLQAEP